MRSLRDYFLLFLKGVGMGGADVIPGVSGGTIAFITGIYTELLESIQSIDKKAIQLILKGEFADFWSHINGNFLIVLVSGILLSIVSLAKLIHYVLTHHAIALWSFFMGLIVISAITILRHIRKFDLFTILAGITGVVVAYFITSATPATTPETYFFLFISGAIAICAMILPGISGSFILLIMGKYQFVITAVRDLNVPVLIVFALGCITGILSFSRLVTWLLKKYHNSTVSLLAGFMLGSINKIWPWKAVLTYRENSRGELVPFVEENILPTDYLAQTGQNPEFLLALLFVAAGVLLVVVIEKIAARQQEKPTRG